ncbi:MAG: rod shape-determining protein MreC [Anaerolineae bacterium]|nr:rod shape-determining protein MreC [Anaerolineae bacterium]
MRTWRSNRFVFLLVCLAFCLGLIFASQLGLLGPVRGLLATPINWISGLFNRATLDVVESVDQSNDPEVLQRRNADLEEALAQFQAELVDLREIASDYQRIAELLNYTSSRQNEEYVTADVIALADANVPLRTIVINRGARDGVAIGMPVVTQQGLVGRIIDVTANASRVLLVADSSSAISGRLQTTRAEGSVVGQPAGDLLMVFIPLDALVPEGDLVITSGLGGNLPSDIVIGQVTAVQQREFDLTQQATVRSLINFDTLEIVLVITSFQPVDLSVFETPPETGNGG